MLKDSNFAKKLAPRDERERERESESEQLGGLAVPFSIGRHKVGGETGRYFCVRLVSSFRFRRLVIKLQMSYLPIRFSFQRERRPERSGAL